MRKDYELHCIGEKKMDTEKIRKLNELGFKWRIRGRYKRGGGGGDDEEGDDEEEDDDDDDAESSEAESDDDEESVIDTEVEETQKEKVNKGLVPATNSRGVAKGSSGSSNQCSGCFSTILFPSAKCGGCDRGYCQDCFDELLHCNESNCSSCRGPVTATSAGWTGWTRI